MPFPTTTIVLRAASANMLYLPVFSIREAVYVRCRSVTAGRWTDLGPDFLNQVASHVASYLRVGMDYWLRRAHHRCAPTRRFFRRGESLTRPALKTASLCRE